MLRDLEIQGMIVGPVEFVEERAAGLFYAPRICYVPFEVGDNMLAVKGRFLLVDYYIAL